MRCPLCHQPNQPAAPFGVECGAALALNNAAESAARRLVAQALITPI
jgi:hypothetical protein